MDDKRMTTNEAAKVLGVTPDYVRQLILAGALPAEKIGSRRRGMWLIDPADLEPFKEQKPGPGRPRKGRAE